MNQENLTKWELAAWALPGPAPVLHQPFAVLTGEAVEVARFCRRYWEPGVERSDMRRRPGLKSAVGNGTFNDVIATELLELLEALHAAQTRYQLLVGDPDAEPMLRAQVVLGELRATLAWAFDDGQVDELDQQLQNLVKTHHGALSQDAVAAALYDFAELADRNRERIAGLGEFDVDRIDEARELADALRERSAVAPTIGPAPEASEAIELRNRIGALLFERMQRVRAAARFVFRDNPALVRKVTSAYERERAANRRHRGRPRGAAGGGRAMGTMGVTE